MRNLDLTINPDLAHFGLTRNLNRCKMQKLSPQPEISLLSLNRDTKG